MRVRPDRLDVIRHDWTMLAANVVCYRILRHDWGSENGTAEGKGDTPIATGWVVKLGNLPPPSSWCLCGSGLSSTSMEAGAQAEAACGLDGPGAAAVGTIMADGKADHCVLCLCHRCVDAIGPVGSVWSRLRVQGGRVGARPEAQPWRVFTTCYRAVNWADSAPRR